jgi:hypothetical protein
MLKGLAEKRRNYLAHGFPLRLCYGLCGHQHIIVNRQSCTQGLPPNDIDSLCIIHQMRDATDLNEWS